MSRCGKRVILFLGVILGAALSSCGPDGAVAPALAPGTGMLRIAVHGREGPVPARLQIVDTTGQSHVPSDALAIGGDCVARPKRLTAEEIAAAARPVFIEADTQERHTYVDGGTALALEPGSYTIVASRGLEHRVASISTDVVEGEVHDVTVRLERWIDLDAEGWSSSDSHLHIPRADDSRNEILHAWMRAEDLHVANLLQWGNADGFENSAQYAFGSPGTSVRDATILLPGQEQPRTSFMGHALILGAERSVQPRPSYLGYRSAFAAGRRANGLTGIGHAGEWGGWELAAALLPEGLLDFVETFTFRTPDFDLWYEILNTGFRVAATAGSDYPCGGGGVPPGAMRFYARTDGDATTASWKRAVRDGETFVTNGAIPELEVNGVPMGRELAVELPSRVRVRGRVRFDPDREQVRAVDLLRNGQLVDVFSETTAPGEIAFETRVRVREGSWLALRVFGRRFGSHVGWRNAFAHSAPVYIEPLDGVRSERTARARQATERWMQRLDALEARLVDEQELARLASRGADGIRVRDLRRGRVDLIRVLQRARQLWAGRLAAFD